MNIFHFLMPISITLCAREKTRSEELDPKNYGVVYFIPWCYLSSQCHYSSKIMLNLNTTEGVILDVPPKWQEWLDTSQVAVSAVGKYMSSHALLLQFLGTWDMSNALSIVTCTKYRRSQVYTTICVTTKPISYCPEAICDNF